MTNSIPGEEVLPGCMVFGVHHDCEKCPNLIDMGDGSGITYSEQKTKEE